MRKVWFVEITIPFELMDDIKQGSIDLAGETIDLSEIQDAYDEDLDDTMTDESTVETAGEEEQTSTALGQDNTGMM
jgi:hypothetical protein